MDITATPAIKPASLVPGDAMNFLPVKTPKETSLPTFSLPVPFGVALISPEVTAHDLVLSNNSQALTSGSSGTGNCEKKSFTYHGDCSAEGSSNSSSSNNNNNSSNGVGVCCNNKFRSTTPITTSINTISPVPTSVTNVNFNPNLTTTTGSCATCCSPHYKKRPEEVAREVLVLTNESLPSRMQAFSPRAITVDKKKTAGPPSIPHIPSGSGLRLNKFVRRLHDMLQSEKDSGIVEWRRGLLVLHSTDAFAKTILPKYFNTRNFKTFRRQLNYYGFVHVRSFSTTGSTTTALWVNRDLAKLGSADISSVLLLKRVEPCEAAKTAEGRRVRKELAIFTVEEDIGVSPKTLQLEQIRSLALRAGEDSVVSSALHPACTTTTATGVATSTAVATTAAIDRPILFPPPVIEVPGCPTATTERQQAALQHQPTFSKVSPTSSSSSSPSTGPSVSTTLTSSSLALPVTTLTPTPTPTPTSTLPSRTLTKSMPSAPVLPSRNAMSSKLRAPSSALMSTLTSSSSAVLPSTSTLMSFSPSKRGKKRMADNCFTATAKSTDATDDVTSFSMALPSLPKKTDSKKICRSSVIHDSDKESTSAANLLLLLSKGFDVNPQSRNPTVLESSTAVSTTSPAVADITTSLS